MWSDFGLYRIKLAASLLKRSDTELEWITGQLVGQRQQVRGETVGVGSRGPCHPVETSGRIPEGI